MKPEYKMRAQEHLEAITKRAKVIAEMLKGERPADQAQAIKLSNEIERLVELTTNIVDLSYYELVKVLSWIFSPNYCRMCSILFSNWIGCTI